MFAHEQHDTRFEMCQEHLHVIEMDPDYLKRVITSDESEVHYFRGVEKDQVHSFRV